MADAVPFYAEQAGWPFVHAVVPLALYFATRDLELTLLLIYVWESVERVLALFIKYFKESVYDSLIGDPLVGATAAFTFWLLDQATGWDDALRANVSPLRRAACFIVIAALASFIELGSTRVVHVGVLIYTLFYTIVALLFYGSAPLLVLQSVLAWLIIVHIYALAAAPRITVPSTFLRVFGTELLVLVGALIALLIKIVH